MTARLSGKRTFRSIRRALRASLGKVSATQTWIEIHRETGIGRRVGDELLLSHTDREKARAWIRDLTGADPLTDEVRGDRVEAAAVVRDEKWATETVFGALIRIARRNAPVDIDGISVTIPNGASLEVESSRIRMDDIETVVVVENGAAFLHWHRFEVPTAIVDALVVYRGHDESGARVNSFLNRLRPRSRVVGFFDYDPAGFSLAVDHRVDALLLPANPSEVLRGASKGADVYRAQHAARPGLGKLVPDGWLPHWCWLSEHSAAITQEHIAALKWPLELVPAGGLPRGDG